MTQGHSVQTLISAYHDPGRQKAGCSAGAISAAAGAGMPNDPYLPPQSVCAWLAGDPVVSEQKLPGLSSAPWLLGTACAHTWAASQHTEGGGLPVDACPSCLCRDLLYAGAPPDSAPAPMSASTHSLHSPPGHPGAASMPEAACVKDIFTRFRLCVLELQQPLPDIFKQ